MQNNAQQLEQVVRRVYENVESSTDKRQEDKSIGPTHYGEITSYLVVDETTANGLLAQWFDSVSTEAGSGKCVTREERHEYHMTDGVVLVTTTQEPRGAIRYLKRYPVAEARRLRYTSCPDNVRTHGFWAREVEASPDRVPEPRKSIAKRIYQIAENDFLVYQIVVEWPATILPEDDKGRMQGEGDVERKIKDARSRAVILYNLMQESKAPPVVTAGVSLVFTPDTCTLNDEQMNQLLEQFIQRVEHLSNITSSATCTASSSDTNGI